MLLLRFSAGMVRKHSPGLYSLAVSTAYIALTSMIAFWLRKIVNRLFPESNLTKILLLELIAAAELCACCFELIIGKFGLFHCL